MLLSLLSHPCQIFPVLWLVLFCLSSSPWYRHSCLWIWSGAASQTVCSDPQPGPAGTAGILNLLFKLYNTNLFTYFYYTPVLIHKKYLLNLVMSKLDCFTKIYKAKEHRKSLVTTSSFTHQLLCNIIGVITYLFYVTGRVRANAHSTIKPDNFPNYTSTCCVVSSWLWGNLNTTFHPSYIQTQ